MYLAHPLRVTRRLPGTTPIVDSAKQRGSPSAPTTKGP
jgi:hypothetical protein